jgi:hypothetical protein
VTTVIAGILVVIYRFVCLHDNKKRDATGVLEGFENAYQDDLTDKTVSIYSKDRVTADRTDRCRILNSGTLFS